MTEATAALSLALHIDGDVPDAGAELGALPEVAQVDRVSTSDDRDLATVATTLVTLTTIVASAGGLMATIDGFFDKAKALAKKHGWKISAEVGRKKIDLDDLTPEQKQQLLEQALAQAIAADT